MKFKSAYFLSAAAVALLAFFAFYPPVNNEEKEAVLIQTIINSLNTLHFQPVQIDDEFSAKVYDIYMDRLDGGRRWLTQKDVNQLEKFQLELDNQANNGAYEFFDTSLKLLNESLTKTQGYYQSALKKDFNFDTAGSIELDGEKRGWAKNDKELEAYWADWSKYETLNRYTDLIEKREKATEYKADEVEEGKEMSEEDLAYKSKSDADLMTEAKEESLKYFDKWYDRLGKMKRHDHLSTYLNAITAVYDPHTSYYEPIDKENFDIRMSGKLEGIGARLQSDDEYTKITSIVVGGPAWKQGELKENDLITAVAQEGEDAVDINGMTINEVVQLIRGKKGTKVILTVKKVNGSSQKIIIERDVVITSEGFAKSLIMKTDEGEQVGYIRLPSFYADFQDRNGRRSAKDVATEVEKLKAQNVEGIVIDLRNNGGGSLRDVVKMSGLFVEDGPMVQVKSRDKKPEVLEDTDSSVLWDGHLIIMVNNFSASASEILAAALQDYERAVIVGSPTFGKGTVQRFFDLDRAISGNSEVKPLGQVKLTTQKFYRVNGGSTQLKGVTPDIILPDNYKYIETGEKETEYPLKWTEIAAVQTEQHVYDVSRNLAKLQAQSAARVKDNAVFSKIDENAKRLKTQRDDTDYPLGLEAYNAEEEAMELIAESFKDMFETEVNMSVENLKVDLAAFEADESKAARNDDFLKNIKKDIYLEEVLNIMDDMVEVNSVAAGKRN